jgi:hypothetical protein
VPQSAPGAAAVPPLVEACSKTDVDCSNPIAQARELVLPNTPLSFYEITVPFGFDGFLHFRADGYLEQSYYLGGPLTRDEVSSRPLPVLQEASYEDFLQGLGVDRADLVGRGLLAFTVLDCNNVPAAGVRLELTDVATDPELQLSKAWVTDNGTPFLSEPRSEDGKQTDEAGLAGFIDVPAIVVAVHGVLILDEERLAFGGLTLPAAANWLTTGEIRHGNGVYGQ